MGFFDKMFINKNMGNKIKIKFVKKADKADEHEQFLKPEEPLVVKVGGEDAVPSKTQKKTPAKSEVIKRTAPVKPAKAPAAPLQVTIKKNTKAVVNNAEPTPNKTTVKVKPAGTPPDNTNDNPLKDGAVTVTESKSTRNGKFDIQKAKDGRFFFNLYASNHTVIAYSQIYSSTSAAMTGIKSIIANAANTPIEDTTLKNPTEYSFPKWEIYIDKAGEYRFRLYATNGNCICHSAHGYATKSGCKGGIDSIGRFASDAAKIDKSYLK